MTIKVRWNVSRSGGVEQIELEDLGVKDAKEWTDLPETEKHKRLQAALDEVFEQPYMELYTYE